MPITVVSAPPQTAQAPAPDSSGSTENTGSGNDFASLLLGQLFQAIPGANSATVKLESVESESSGREDLDQVAASSDSSTLFAALFQAPAEPRNDAATPLPHAGSDVSLAGKTNTVTPTPTPVPPTVLTDSVEVSLPTVSETSSPASGQKAAIFAVSAPPAIGENVTPASLKTAELQLAGTNEAQSSTTVIPATPSSRQETVPLSVPTPLRDRDWNNDFAQKVVWFATSHKQTAELTLTPPQMGSIEISLKIDNDKSTATATFVSTNAEVRETIEAALPRLREMLAGVGIQLGQTNVSAESFRQQTPGEGGGAGDASRSASDNAILAPDSPGSLAAGRVAAGQGRGLVDIFA